MACDDLSIFRNVCTQMEMAARKTKRKQKKHKNKMVKCDVVCNPQRKKKKNIAKKHRVSFLFFSTAMARTKQTARKCTGGKPPRRPLPARNWPNNNNNNNNNNTPESSSSSSSSSEDSSVFSSSSSEEEITAKSKNMQWSIEQLEKLIECLQESIFHHQTIADIIPPDPPHERKLPLFSQFLQIFVNKKLKTIAVSARQVQDKLGAIRKSEGLADGSRLDDKTLLPDITKGIKTCIKLLENQALQKDAQNNDELQELKDKKEELHDLRTKRKKKREKERRERSSSSSKKRKKPEKVY